MGKKKEGKKKKGRQGRRTLKPNLGDLMSAAHNDSAGASPSFLPSLRSRYVGTRGPAQRSPSTFKLVPAALPSLLTFPEDSGLAADPEAAAPSPLLEAATGASASPRSFPRASGSCRGAAAAPAPPARGTTPRCGEPARRLRARGGAAGAGPRGANPPPRTLTLADANACERGRGASRPSGRRRAVFPTHA